MVCLVLRVDSHGCK